MFSELKSVLKHFEIEGQCIDIQPLKRGHINDTFVSCWEQNKHRNSFVHQRINHHVFPDIAGLMSNVQKVTCHLKEKFLSGQHNLSPLELIPTKNKLFYHVSESGNFWRTYNLIENAESYYVCKSSNLAESAATACGVFQSAINDLDPLEFNIVIPDFHNIIVRYKQLEDAISQDTFKRVKQAKEQISFVKHRESESAAIHLALETGDLPWRVTHNDLKFNNVLFDKTSGVPVSVVDLDTCMPGSVLYDFGDLVRNTSVPADEDEQDLSKVFMDLEYFSALTRGYFSQIFDIVSDNEWKLVSIAPRILTLTIGIRFLTDFLNGDKYFKTEFPTHNLVRAKSQFKIVQDMEFKQDQMLSIVSNCRKQLTKD